MPPNKWRRREECAAGSGGLGVPEAAAQDVEQREAALRSVASWTQTRKIAQLPADGIRSGLPRISSLFGLTKTSERLGWESWFWSSTPPNLGQLALSVV